MHEWSLLIFTICLQVAIGGTWMLAIYYKKINLLNSEDSFKLMKLPLITISILSLIGLVASFTHLGTPAHAFHTIRNIGSSWMSREILFTGLFIGAIVITTALALYQKKVNPYLLGVSAIIGFIDVFCMAALYANSLVSGWNSIHTYTSFYGTAIVLGPVLIATLVVPLLKENELGSTIGKNAFYISLFGLAVQFIGLAVFGSTVQEVSIIANVNALTVLEGYQMTVAIRWMIEVIGVAILGILALGNSKKLSYTLAYVALVALIFAEGISRYVFYLMGA